MLTPNLPTLPSAASDSSPDVPSTLTKTHYQRVAEEFIKSLDAVADLIPARETAHGPTVTYVRRRKNVPYEFLATAIASVEMTPELAAVNKLDIARSRDALQFIEAFRPAIDKVAMIAESLQFTIDLRLATLALDSLQIYAIAKALARDANSTAVAAAAVHMKRDLHRRNALSPRARGKGDSETPVAKTAA